MVKGDIFDNFKKSFYFTNFVLKGNPFLSETPEWNFYDNKLVKFHLLFGPLADAELCDS